MLRRVVFCIACAALCSSAAPVLAQQLGNKVVTTYTTLGINQAVDGNIVDVESDATNRVWAVAPGRASAVLGSVRAPLFPITVADTPLAPAAGFRSVSFAVPAGNSGDGEHFYLGSTAGIAWGRLASTVEIKARSLVLAPPAGTTFPAGDDPNEVRQTDTDGSEWLWAATSGGLVLWDLTEADPTATIYLDDASDGPIDDVAVAPWGDAAAVDGERLWLVDVAGNATLIREFSSGVFRGIAFDAFGNLWAATSGSSPLIWKFSANATNNGLSVPGQSFPLNPPAPSVGLFPTDIAVDPITGRVWVTTAGNQGPDKTAYYQDPDAAGDLGGAWESVASTFDAHTVVHADAAGNAWFGMTGSSEALNGYVVRLLTLDKSRYLGADTGVATLFDLTLAGSDTASLTIEVGSDSREFDLTEAGSDSGTFVQTFRIVPSDAAGGSGDEFLASSSADDVPVQARYTFTDANSQDRELTATASWANIVPFEDDLWIGGGPCFLHSLEW